MAVTASASREGSLTGSEQRSPTHTKAAELPGVFNDFIDAKISRRIVVDLNE